MRGSLAARGFCDLLQHVFSTQLCISNEIDGRAAQVHTTKFPDKHPKKSGLHYKEFTWPDGGKYEGEWLDGKMHGKGTYVEADGSRYEGQWREGKMHGKGTQIFAKGDRYEGEYHDGHRHGKGKQSFANGNLYVGNFWQGQIHGIGTYTCADGRVYSGEFKNNKLADPQFSPRALHIRRTLEQTP